MAENRKTLTLKRKPAVNTITPGQIISSRRRQVIIPGHEKSAAGGVADETKINPAQAAVVQNVKLVKPARKPKQEKKVPLDQALQLLSKYWPDCFSATEAKIMKLKIREDLFNDSEVRQLPISRKQIRHSLKAVASSKEYLVGLVAGANRHDMHGQPAGIVTPSESLRAEQRLKQV